MNFIDSILNSITDFAGYIGNLVSAVVDFLAKPLSYLLSFLDGIFYFISVLFDIVIKVIMIFVACFQFVVSLVMGLFRTLSKWMSFSFDTSYVSFPSTSGQGFQAVVDVLQPTGLFTVVPMILTGLVWIAFIFKIIGLFGGNPSRLGGADD